MSEPRIKAGIWVSAALRLGGVDGKPGMVIRKGDPDAGGVLLREWRKVKVSGHAEAVLTAVQAL